MISIYYLIKFSCCSAETKYRCQNDTINLNFFNTFLTDWNCGGMCSAPGYTYKPQTKHLSLCLWIVPWRPMTLLMTTMCPERLFFMSGITSLIMRTTPKKLVSNTFFISSMLMLSTGPNRPTPALLTDGKHTSTRMTHCLYLPTPQMSRLLNDLGDLIWSDISE